MNTLLAKSPQSISPVVRQTLDGIAAGLSVDRAVVDGEFLAVSGWAIDGHNLTFTVAEGAGVPMFPSLSFFPRDDVAAGYNVAPELAKGFLAIWRNRPRGDMVVRLGTGAGQPLQIELPAPEQSAPAEIVQLLKENLPRAGRLFAGLVHNPAAISVLLKHLEEAPPGFNRAKEHIDAARGIEGVGGLVVGWTVGEPDRSCRRRGGGRPTYGRRALDAQRHHRSDEPRFRRLRLQRRLLAEMEQCAAHGRFRALDRIDG